MDKLTEFLYPLKFMGYCMSNMPPEGVAQTFEDFVNFAKYQLCYYYKIPMKSEVWDSYIESEILVEYFALLFSQNEKAKNDFEAVLSGLDTDTLAWFDDQIAKNKIALAEKFEIEAITLDGVLNG